MMQSPRSIAIRRSDAFAADFAATIRATTVLGDSLAAAEIASLHEMAETILSDMARWRGLMAPLDAAMAGRFDEKRACAVILETVFDEVLSPPAWRVLRSALEIADASARSRSPR